MCGFVAVVFVVVVVRFVAVVVVCLFVGFVVVVVVLTHAFPLPTCTPIHKGLLVCVI